MHNSYKQQDVKPANRVNLLGFSALVVTLWTRYGAL